MIASPEVRAAKATLAADRRERRQARPPKAPDWRKRAIEPGDATPRRAMTPSRRARILARSDGHCSFPGCVSTLDLEVDHTIALELGGRDDDGNLAVLCKSHHLYKTRHDIRAIAKVRRLVKKNNTPRKPSRIKSRGFQ